MSATCRCGVRCPKTSATPCGRRADERAKQETDKAYQESGLTLDRDEREVFDLRYRQERRKLERELQDRANAERARRLAEISDRLKHEFTGRTAGTPPPPPPPPAPKKTATQARGHASRHASRRDAVAGVHALKSCVRQDPKDDWLVLLVTPTPARTRGPV